MASPDQSQVTEILRAVSAGDSQAVNRLIPLVYEELRSMAKGYMQRESKGHTLQPTALVNEVFIKLVDQDRVNWRGRSHFFAVCAQAMRRVLVDHARTKHRAKRGGGERPISLDEKLVISQERTEDLLALDDALNKLARLDPRQAKIVELRFFGGLTVQETAEVLGVSNRTVENEWTMVRAWLRRELSEDD
jgi:RNA polymerase sigma factor (TIGR02999 family)